MSARSQFLTSGLVTIAMIMAVSGIGHAHAVSARVGYVAAYDYYRSLYGEFGGGPSAELGIVYPLTRPVAVGARLGIARFTGTIDCVADCNDFDAASWLFEIGGVLRASTTQNQALLGYVELCPTFFVMRLGVEQLNTDFREDHWVSSYGFSVGGGLAKEFDSVTIEGGVRVLISAKFSLKQDEDSVFFGDLDGLSEPNVYLGARW